MKYSELNKKQITESGSALTLILLLIVLFKKYYFLIPWITGITVFIMIYPMIFKPFAFIWFNISEVLGKIVSSLLLGVLFAFVLTPISIIRKISGADSMNLKTKHQGTNFEDTPKLYTRDDLKHQF